MNTTTAGDTEYLGYFPAATATLTATAGAPPSYDYGDAPTAGTAPSGTGSNNYGEARHEVVAGLHLGAVAPDNDASYQSSATADGDDTDGTDDDDGISSLPALATYSNSYTIPAANISATGTGMLHAWIDFDGNTTFEADEAAARVVPAGTNAGDFVVAWSNIPADIQAGQSYLRLRFTTDAMNANEATGFKQDGEVEDHSLSIGDAGATVSGRIYISMPIVMQSMIAKQASITP